MRTGAGGDNPGHQFTDLFIATYTLGTVTNYLDVGGATNAPPASFACGWCRRGGVTMRVSL
jgi:hypothetical protein